jgi:hypothetical protein
MFGVSGICNVLGAIRLARHLDLGPEDNVVTIATDGFDRYPSVLTDLASRCGETGPGRLNNWFESIFRSGNPHSLLDVRPASEKSRLFAYKEQVWLNFGYSRAYLQQMQSQSFWEAQYEAIHRIDEDLATRRRHLPV